MGSFNSAVNRKENNKKIIQGISHRYVLSIEPFLRTDQPKYGPVSDQLMFWTDGPTDRMTDRPTDRPSGPTNRWTNQPTDGPTNQPMDQCTGKHYLSQRCKDASEKIEGGGKKRPAMRPQLQSDQQPTNGRTDK